MRTDHVKMLYDIGELNNIFTQSMSIESFLQKIVETVAEHMNAEVCSIFLYNDIAKELTLKATIGLKTESVNNIKLKLGEGLIGQSLLDLTAICEKCTQENPNFKFYSGIDEEYFDSFLVAPIARGNVRIGAFVIQKQKGESFDEQDVVALKATASQLASMIENIKLIMYPFHEIRGVEDRPNIDNLKFINGKAGSKGYAYSEILIIDEENIHDFSTNLTFKEKYTLADFNNAIKSTEYQLNQLQKKVEEKLSDAASLIFSAQLLMLKDRNFTGSMRELIEKGENSPDAVLTIYKKYHDIFIKSPNRIIREKVQDIGDLAKRIIDNLVAGSALKKQYEGRIIVARDIYPSDLLTMSVENVSGIILVSGGVTSHVSILARSLNVPLIIANVVDLLYLPEKTKALIDAESGNLYINPSPDIVTNFKESNKARVNYFSDDILLKQPAETRDNTPIKLMVNINLLSDLKNIKGIANDGIGLYRTEFPFIIRNTFPSEEEQFVIYSKLIKSINDRPAVFRTLDIGGDKILPYYQEIKEENPFLGMRSIRFSLNHKDLFKQQLRAILRAGYEKNIKIMFPMISSLDEFINSKEIVNECIRELESEKKEHNNSPEIGAMIEIPSIVNLIEDLANESAFFSIGTNDLIQYTLAVDRTNENVADFYIPHHPAILKSLKKIVDAGANNGIEVSVCGDMAGDKKYIPFLLGIGIRALSVDSGYLLTVKKILSNISIKKAEKIADDMLSENRISEITKIVESLKDYSI